MHPATLQKNNINRFSVSILSLTSLFNSLFLLFIIIFPSGTIFGINVKMLSMIAMIFFNLIFIFKNGKLKKYSLFCLAITLLSIGFVFVFYMIGHSYGNIPEHVNSETMLFLAFFIPCMFLYIAIIEGSIKPDKIIKIITYGSVFYSLMKLALVVLFAFNIVPIYLVVIYLQESHGVYPMMMQITSTLTRFQLANDFIMCFLLFIMILKSELFSFLNKKTFILIFLILMASVMVSFSRYMFMVVFLAIFVKILLLKRITSIGMAYFVGALFITTIVLFSSFDVIFNALDVRFNSSSTETSDRTRDLQFDCLSRSAFESPMYGNGGLGAYNKSCPGPDGDEYSYEVQYLGFAYKFGIFFTTILILLYSYQMIGSYNGKFFSRKNIPISIGLVSWLCVGMFNPYLVSAYASVIMTMFFCCLDRKY